MQRSSCAYAFFCPSLGPIAHSLGSMTKQIFGPADTVVSSHHTTSRQKVRQGSEDAHLEDGAVFLGNTVRDTYMERYHSWRT